MTKPCQVPDLLPVEKAHLRARRISYRSALLAVLCSHKGSSTYISCLIVWLLILVCLNFIIASSIVAGVVRVGCDDTDSVTHP